MRLTPLRLAEDLAQDREAFRTERRTPMPPVYSQQDYFAGLWLSDWQYRVHSAISRRRFSNRSPRLYAASTLLPITCARAISTMWFGKLVRSAAQSRKLERKP